MSKNKTEFFCGGCLRWLPIDRLGRTLTRRTGRGGKSVTKRYVCTTCNERAKEARKQNQSGDQQ